MPSAIPRLKKVQPVTINVADATVRDFSRGLSYAETETSLPPGASILAKNMVINADNSMAVRQGYAEVYDFGTNVVETVYFADSIVAFKTDGTIEAYNFNTDTGAVIWNDTIANALPSAPDGWNATTHIDYTEFKTALVVVNGSDKPIVIDTALDVTYLQDLATGSNVNTPIAKYITTTSNFVVMADVTGSEELYISAYGTSGTWLGDPAPNNAVVYDVAGAAGRGSEVYKGLATFRNFLYVFFEGFVALVRLGTFDGDGNHVPELVDTFSDVNLVNHRCIIETDTDLLLATQKGIISSKKVAFGGTVENSVISNDLGEEYTRTTSRLSASPAQCFLARDIPTNKLIVRFICNIGGVDTTFVMNHTPDFKKRRWTTFEDWPAKGATNSYRGRLFFFNGTKLYLQGNDIFEDENYTTDNITEAETEGTPISFDWELPWTDFGSRAKAKRLIDFIMETTGSARFTLELYINNFRKDLDDNDTPALSMQFVAGDTVGYGATTSGGYGGGRKANDERFYRLPAKFKIIKIRFKGDVTAPLSFSSYTAVYLRGHYKP